MISSVADPSLLAAFADSASQLLGGVNQRARWRTLREAAIPLDRAVWSQYAAAGWLSILLPETDGGLGLDLRSVTAIAEAIGAHLAPEPFVMAGVRTALALRYLPPSPLRSKLVNGLREGSLLLGVAWAEAAGQLDLATSSATVHRDGNDWILSGCKAFVEPSNAADGWLIQAMANSEHLLFWVPANANGVSIANQRRVDGGLWGSVSFNQTRLPASHLLAQGNAVDAALAEADDGARLAQCAELLGIARRAMDITLDYLRVRKQFGQAIGSFQALQHRMVDARLQIDLAAAALNEALQGDWSTLSRVERARRASRSKSRCADAALHMTRLAIQLHGAVGYTDEYDIGLYMKRALALNASLGSAQAHRKRFFGLSSVDASGNAASNAAPVAATTSAARPVASATSSARPHVDDYPPDTDWDSLDEATLRGAVRSFLEAYYPQHLRNLPRDAHWHQVQDWMAVLARRGWVAPSWPKEFGGMGLSPAKLIAFFEEMAHYGVARFISNGLQMLGPLLMKFGTPAQRAEYLPRILTNEQRWAQGYSEPNAGSDLGSLTTHARLEGDSFVINGRKIWTSHALNCTHMFMLVRTEKTPRPSDGISFLLLDLKTPGITVRGIQNLSLDTNFAEVTFDEVRVPVANLVGEINGGWKLAKALLGHERLFTGEPSPTLRIFHQLTELAMQRRLFDDAGFVERYVQLQLDVLDHQALYNHFAEIVKQGGTLGPDVSLLKIYATETRQRAAALLSDAAAESGVNMEPQQIGDAELNLVTPLLIAIQGTIAAGSNEIQRNIVARHVLHLP
ncbi:MAG: acyl-CoA dehydrogenase [Janthinobacterium lividum]